MSRLEKIQQIIRKREPLVTQIQQVTNNLTTLKSRIDSLDKLRLKLIQETNEVSVSSHLSTLDLVNLSVNIGHQLDGLNQLIIRYKRGTINIGVVGLMGQEKSRFLQSISGLGDDVIPARPGKACTACKSSIEHQEGETKADVTL